MSQDLDRRHLLTLLAGACLAAAPLAQAQTYPDKPVRFVVPLNSRCSRKWVEPWCPLVSSREPTATENDTEALWALGIVSVKTRTPLGRTDRRIELPPEAVNESSLWSSGNWKLLTVKPELSIALFTLRQSLRLRLHPLHPQQLEQAIACHGHRSW